MVTERYLPTDEHMNCAEVRLSGEFSCATYPFLFSKNKKISLRLSPAKSGTIEQIEHFMTRIKRGTTSLKRRHNILKQTKGYHWGRKSKERAATEALLHAGTHAFNDRRKEKE